VPQFVEVRFKGNRKQYYEWHDPEPLREHEPVLVETDRGVDLGHVGATGRIAQTKRERCTGCALAPASDAAPDGAPGHEEEGLEAAVLVLAADEGSGDVVAEPVAAERGAGAVRRVVRRASPADVRQSDELRRAEDDVRRKIRERIAPHRLQMKVSDAEWQWDRKKLTVYFTAEKRVDFRNLVRELASLFRTRIELRQIGVRDEAVRLDGIGRCGRRLCSASFLTELRPIGLQIAKDQRLSLNPSQISGPCGRLLCCLRFEHDFYVQSRKRFPKENRIVQTSLGAEKVYSIDIFRDRVTLRAEDGTTRTLPLAELRSDIERAAQGLPPLASAAAPEPAPPTTPQPAPPARQAPRAQRRPAGRTPRPNAPTVAPAPPAAPSAPPAAAEAPAAGEATGQAPHRRRRRRGRRRPPPST
jgi:cell fate regulator YaaT (PSP1 superfamily)